MKEIGIYQALRRLLDPAFLVCVGFASPLPAAGLPTVFGSGCVSLGVGCLWLVWSADGEASLKGFLAQGWIKLLL